jgi:hypothetical protein
MPRTVVIDELHLTVRVPSGLPETEADAVRRTLAADEFMDRLRRAVRVVLRAFPDLAPARISVTR